MHVYCNAFGRQNNTFSENGWSAVAADRHRLAHAYQERPPSRPVLSADLSLGSVSNLLAPDDDPYCKRITAFPKEVFRLNNLKRLDLYCCENLKALPIELGRLASSLDHLEVLRLHRHDRQT